MKKIPKSEIEAILAPLAGDFGVYVENIDTGEAAEINTGHPFPSASIIKVPMLALLLRDAEQGRVDLHAPRRLAPENRVGGFGVLAQLPETVEISYLHMARLMIVLSDNAATNEIMDAIGVERFNEFCREMGWPNTRLMRKMMDYQAIREGRNNYTSAGESGRTLARIARGELVSREASGTILDMMTFQQCRNKLPAMIPAVPTYAPPEDSRNIPPGRVVVANKTGDQYNLQHDVGVFTLPDRRRYVIAFLSEKLASDYEGVAAAGKVSLAVYEALK